MHAASWELDEQKFWVALQNVVWMETNGGWNFVGAANDLGQWSPESAPLLQSAFAVCVENKLEEKVCLL